MSLTSIRTFGWLTGQQTQIRTIGTFGWFVEQIPTFPVVSLFSLPAEILSVLNKPETIPIEYGGVVSAVSFDKFIPIDFVANIPSFLVSPVEQLAQLQQNRNLLIESILDVDFSRFIPSEYKIQTNSLNRIPVEYLQGISQIYRPLIEIIGSPNLRQNIPIEFQGQVIPFSTDKFIPIDFTSSVFLASNFAINYENTVVWVLDSRGVLWQLSSRSTNWLIEQLTSKWVLSGKHPVCVAQVDPITSQIILTEELDEITTEVDVFITTEGATPGDKANTLASCWILEERG